ncbi:MAG TPA: hypothetical protein VFU11_00985 [Solirubrobacterales bacterium]|nr:hypothetical protein [Solirubrobacterales bacterium]
MALAAGSADGAVVKVNDIVLRADGGFTPQALPKRQFAPIDFHGQLDISSRSGGRPPKLEQALVDFDRDGRLSVGGLPSCAPEAVATLGTPEARQTCGAAIVGTGHIEVYIPSSDHGGIEQRLPLTVFNGPRGEGGATAVLHAPVAAPTHAILVPIETRRGGYRYRVRIDLPSFASDFAITHADVQIGRRYVAGGERRSYASARCSDNVLQTHGRFSFENGTIVDGLVEKYCRSK